MVKPEGILASNTSSISITRIAAATQRPEQVVHPSPKCSPWYARCGRYKQRRFRKRCPVHSCCRGRFWQSLPCLLHPAYISCRHVPTSCVQPMHIFKPVPKEHGRKAKSRPPTPSLQTLTLFQP